MRALVCHGPGESSWDTVPEPGIEDAAAAIVCVGTTTICGSDPHILKRDVPGLTPDTTSSHTLSTPRR